jgi:hypothetical protein
MTWHYVALPMLLCLAAEASAAVLDLPCVAEAWETRTQGKFSAHFDRREICRISFPWETSERGDCGGLVRTVTIPADWKPPFWLRWYCSDNYTGEGVDRSMVGEGRSAVVLIGHRFKQVLIDDRVIWDRDVADPIFPGAKSAAMEPAGGADPFPPYFRVDITPYVTPGQPFELSLRVFDQAATTERLDQDWRAEFRFYDKPVDMKNTTFSTDVYWADVTLHQGEAPTVTEVRPSWQPTLQPVALPRSPEPVTSRSVPMTLERADLLNDRPFPVSSGVPFPEGAVRDLKLAVTSPDGQVLPAQGQAFQSWPDGSVKWARVDVLASRPQTSDGQWTLTFGSAVEPPAVETPVTVQQAAEAVTVDTGAVRLVVNRVGEDLVESVTIAGQAEPLSHGIGNSLLVGLPTAEADGRIVDRWRTLRARKAAVEVEAAGPLRATLKLTGHLSDGGDAVLGRFVTRLDAYAGQPYVRVRHRIFNDYPAPCVRIRTFDLQVPVAVTPPAEGEQVEAQAPGAYGAGRPPAGIFGCLGPQMPTRELSEVEQLGLVQHEIDRYLLYGVGLRASTDLGQTTGERAAGWGAYWGHRGGAAAFMRHFRQQYPQGLAIDNQQTRSLWLRCFAYCDGQQYYQPTQGEAKRLELWLSFFEGEPSPEALERFNGLVQRPPRLFSAEWVRATGGLGPAPTNPAERFPEVHQATAAAGSWDPDTVAHDGTTGYGLRNWGEWFQTNHWMKAGYGSAWWNNYYDSIFKLVLAYVLGGEPTRFEQAQVQAQHYSDVDVCHFRAGHPEQVGGDYMLAFDHTGQLGDTGIRPSAQGLIAVGLLSADPDILETPTLMADRIVAVVRETEGKLGFRGCAPRCKAFPLTVLTDAYGISPKPEYLEAARKLFEVVAESTDPRRGAQLGCGGPTYYSIGHAEGQTGWALMAYHRATGDQAAARRVIGLAEAMMHEPGGPVTWHPWGHLESEAALYAYAFALTGDPTYLPHAERSLIGQDTKGTWMPQRHLEAMYWLERYHPDATRVENVAEVEG